MRSVIYADFSCPASYLASARVDRLLNADHPVPDWRAVEHRPRLQLIGLPLNEAAGTIRQQELDRVRELLLPGEELPGAAPRRLPNTASAAAAYAEAYGAGVADLVRPLLFRAYWVDGLDIGDPDVLRRLLPSAFRQGRRAPDDIKDFGYAATSQHGPITTAAYRRVHQWPHEWLSLGGPPALTMVASSTTLTGDSVLYHLGELVRADLTVPAGV